MSSDSFGLAAKYVELLVTLASAVTLGLLTFYESVLRVPGIAPWTIVTSMVLLAGSIGAGFWLLSELVGIKKREENLLQPRVRNAAKIQSALYGGALFLLVLMGVFGISGVFCG